MIAEDLRHYLQQGRDAPVRTLDGLGEYDARRPMVVGAICSAWSST